MSDIKTGALHCVNCLYYSWKLQHFVFWLPLSHFNVNSVNIAVFFLNIMSGEADLQLYFPGALKVHGEGDNLVNVNKLLHLMRKWPIEMVLAEKMLTQQIKPLGPWAFPGRLRAPAQGFVLG